MTRTIQNLLMALVLTTTITHCTSDTEIKETNFVKEYKNGNSIKVVREDLNTKYTGMISGINWGNTHSFQYTLLINPNKNEWKGYKGQLPINVLFCKDELFLKIKQEKINVAISKSDDVDTTLYYKNIDNRYFFNFFGDQYFAMSDSSSYFASKKNGVEELISY